MLDKSKYQTPETIGKAVRRGADSFFKSSQKGRRVPDVQVKRVFGRKVISNKK